MKFERKTTVEWGDCDDAGIVFYPKFFYWFDCTWQAMLRSHNLNQRKIRSQYGAVTPLVDVGATFRSPATYDDVITIQAEITEWASRRLRVEYAITCKDRLIATGFEVRAWAMPLPEGGLKGAAIPVDFRALFQA